MNKPTQVLSFVSLIAAVLVGVTSACASRAPGPAQPLKSAGASFKLRPHAFENLSNGLTILWIEDNALPYVSLQLMVKSGSAQDPLGREGLASVTADMLEKGSTRRSGPRISADLEQLGSDFRTEVTPDYTVLSTSALATSRDDILNQFREITLSPSFAPGELERHRKNELGGLTRLPDSPSAYVEHVFPQFLYGPGHAYGHGTEGTAKGLKAISRHDVQNFYNKHFVPGNSVLAVVGQYDEAWASSIRRAFGAWATAPINEQPPGDFPRWKGIESQLVDKPGMNQARVLIGTRGVARDTPDYMEVRAALKILGESFGSRLFEEIRVHRGLTYGISSTFDPREKAGPLGIMTFTRLDKLPELLTETLNVYRAFVAGGVTETEVAQVKAQMNSQFMGMFETAESLARQLLILNRYHISEEYLEQHLKNVDRLTVAAINETITRHFSPHDLRIMVMAPRAAAEPTLKALGPLEVKSFRMD